MSAAHVVAIIGEGDVRAKGLRAVYKRSVTIRMAVKQAIQATRLRLYITPLIITTSTPCQYFVVFEFVLSGKVNNMSGFVGAQHRIRRSPCKILPIVSRRGAVGPRLPWQSGVEIQCDLG